MNKFTLMIASLGIAASAIPATAFAAPAPNHGYGYGRDAGWQNINARQNQLYSRINQGVRNGALTRREADSLRSQFASLNRLEAQYRRSGGGLSLSERRDLDRRFDALSARIKVEKRDRNNRW